MGKRYIASDFHNGNEVADYDRVMSFLDLVDDDADEFLIIGDLEELLWSNMNILTTVEPYRSVNEKIREIARRKLTRYVIGNHDWNAGAFESLMEPVKIVSSFEEDGIYYGHGHEFDLMSFVVGTPVDPIWWHNALPFALPTYLLMWLATKVWAKAEDAYYLGVNMIHERARSFATKHGYHSVVVGHTHFPVVELRGGINIYNSGDMLDSYTYLVQENGIISLRYF